MNLNISALKKNTVIALAVIGGIALIKTTVSIVKKHKAKDDDSDEESCPGKTARPLFEQADACRAKGGSVDMSRRSKASFADMAMSESSDMCCERASR